MQPAQVDLVHASARIPCQQRLLARELDLDHDGPIGFRRINRKYVQAPSVASDFGLAVQPR